MSEQKDVSIRQEERVAHCFGGRRVYQSGGGKFDCGDVLTEDFLIECKTSLTPKPSYSVKKSILEKAKKEAQQMHRPYYCLAFTFGDEEDYFVLDKKSLRYLLEFKEAYKDRI